MRGPQSVRWPGPFFLPTVVIDFRIRFPWMPEHRNSYAPSVLWCWVRAGRAPSPQVRPKRQRRLPRARPTRYISPAQVIKRTGPHSLGISSQSE